MPKRKAQVAKRVSKSKKTERPKKLSPIGRVHLIEWIDHYSRTGPWLHDESITEQFEHPMINYSAGFLIHEDKSKLILALNKGSSGAWADFMVIMKKLILSRKEFDGGYQLDHRVKGSSNSGR